MSKPTEQLKVYWTAAKRQSAKRLPVAGQQAPGEFAVDAGTLVIEGGASRRKFMGILGASTALAGLTSSGCVRKPKEHILPFAKRPEDLIPGVPVYYATAVQIGNTVQGLLVESQDGRPIKIEGNQQHSGSQGKTDAFAQATVLDLYDPDRSTKPKSRTVAATDSGSGSAEEKKERAVELIAQRAYDRNLKRTRSIDAASAARSKYLELGANADIREVKTPAGTALEVRITGDETVDVEWSTAWSTFDELLGKVAAARGDKTAFVVPATMSPSYRYLIRDAVERLPNVKLFIEDVLPGREAQRAAELLSGEGARSHYSIARAQVIFSADCDFLGTDDDHTRLAVEWAKHRKVEKPGDSMSRLYTVEAQLSVTGAAADHRLRMRSGDVADALKALIRSLADKQNVAAPSGSEALVAAVKAPELDETTQKWVDALAKDLAAQKDAGAVLVGARQPAGAHALGLLANAMLGALGRGDNGSQRLRIDQYPLALPGLEGLALAIEREQIENVICIGTNPIYFAPNSLGLKELFQKLKAVVHAGRYYDETAELASLHLPTSHYLESWGDLEANDGTRSICQPLIAPLYDTPSELEVLGRALQPGSEPNGYEIVRAFWKREFAERGHDDKQWKRWLNDGVINERLRERAIAVPTGWDKLTELVTALPASSAKGVEINFHVDPKVHVGEFANNAWMQECPHPLTKLVWDNAALISKPTADKLRVSNGDMLAIKIGERSMSLPAWIAFGQADDTVSLNLGYGRKLGSVSDGSGFDVNALRSHTAPSFEVGDASRGAGTYQLVSTQDYGLLDPDGPDGKGLDNYPERPIYRETTVEGFKKNKNFAQDGDLIQDPDRLEPLWKRPEFLGSHQWGMAIDLNNCTGCNACVVACQAENNIPVVGKKECSNGREMHWIRLDRYYRGSEADPQAVVMPMLCQHCETAPCENVCPVQATAHSPEGLNDMAYNRCVGTRYCANNCPYKVRRFNFFNYNKDIPEVLQLGKNPDVTVRFRGVIEKCSYCVQRINGAKIQAHIRDRDTVNDNDLLTACQQVCPSSAIVFGNIQEVSSRVYKAKAQSRNYGVLSDLGTLPRTTYLGRVRNPNPELG